MLRVLGKLIWRQSRDISVCNYPRHTVYEIFTNQGTLRLIQEKDTSRFEVIDCKQKIQVPPIQTKANFDLE